jgi:hypothetical protein
MARIVAPGWQIPNFQPRILQASRHKVITVYNSSQGRLFAVTLVALNSYFDQLE